MRAELARGLDARLSVAEERDCKIAERIVRLLAKRTDVFAMGAAITEIRRLMWERVHMSPSVVQAWNP